MGLITVWWGLFSPEARIIILMLVLFNFCMIWALNRRHMKKEKPLQHYSGYKKYIEGIKER